MARTVFTGREIAHVWASNTQPEGRCGSANQSFTRNAFRSYGTGIAWRVAVGGGEMVVINAYSHSASTAKHVGMVRQAFHGHANVLITNAPIRRGVGQYEFPEDSIQNALSARIARTENTIANSKRPGCNMWGAYQLAVRHFNTLASHFHWGMITPVETPAELVEVAEARFKREREARKAAALRVERFNAALLPHWLVCGCAFDFDGDRVAVPSCFQSPTQYMRLDADGENIETSSGAIVPTAIVKRALRSVLPIINADQTWERNGQTIALGHYQVDSVGDGLVMCGCHQFTYEEVKRVAALLGV